MHLQTIVHSVAFFGIENAAAPVSGQPRKIHSKARFGLQDESVQGIARGSLPLKASAAQAVAAFFTRTFYHTPGRLSSIFMRFFKKDARTREWGNSISAVPPLIASGGCARSRISFDPVGV